MLCQEGQRRGEAARTKGARGEQEDNWRELGAFQGKGDSCPWINVETVSE